MRNKSHDIADVSPEVSKVRLENDRVKVTELHFKPGYKTPMHSHPAFVMYSLADSRIKFTYPDGREEIVAFYSGEIKFFEAVTHAAENIGTIETHDLIVELKQ